MICMMTSMIDMAVPSVSLEGKSIWIPQSLPVAAKTVLRAKASVQLILAGVPAAFAIIASMIFVNAPLVVKALCVLTVLTFVFFSTMFGMYLGLRMANLHWVNELSVIKQNGSVMIIIFGTWIISLAMAGVWLFIAYEIGAAAYLAILCVLFGAAGLFFLHWLDTKGAEHFASL
jgi:ABC-2 type transport system permease protein